MRISDWSSDVCSSDLAALARKRAAGAVLGNRTNLGEAQIAGAAGNKALAVRFAANEIGRAQCRGRGCEEVKIAVGAEAITKENEEHENTGARVCQTEEVDAEARERQTAWGQRG